MTNTAELKKPISLQKGFLKKRTQEFNPIVASHAILDGLKYLQNRLDWSGKKIANVLHLAPNTVTGWLAKGSIPLRSKNLHPDIQAVIHLLAIHRSLEAMFENPSHQRAWLKTSHPQLNGIPENLMSESIEGLIFIRQYLDYVRGRGV